MNVQKFNDIYTKMTSQFVSLQKKVTDFNEGSIISTIFESVARVIERIYIDTRNGYANNLKAIAYSIFGFSKKEGSYATSTVIFSRSSAIDVETVIPVGTKVSSGSYVYLTTIAGVINAGEISSNSVGVVAEAIGTLYNVSIGSINTIESSISSDVTSVTNNTAASGGTDTETDTETLARFKKYINGLQGTNNYGMEAAALSVSGVRSVSVVEQFPPLNNIYNVVLYVDDGTGGMTDTLKQSVEDVINGVDSSSGDAKSGYRGAGINVLVSAPTIVPVAVELTCSIYRTDSSLATSDINEAITEEINGLGIGEDVVLTSLILRLRRISYIKDVTGLKFNGEFANVNIDEKSIARLSGTPVLTLINV